MGFRICELCEIRYPVLLGPMLHISTASMVTAFSEAGGLGCLAAAQMDETRFREQVRAVRSRTRAPFAVNIAWASPGSEATALWCVKEGVRIVVSSAGGPREPLERLKDAGVMVLQVVANVAQARRAEALGLDGVIAKGAESGGLNALDAPASMPLIPQVVDAVSLPVVGAGGIGDGRGLAAAVALGADGVLMGTRFLAAAECPVHPAYKAAVLAAGNTDTVSLMFPSFSARVLKSERSLNFAGHDSPFDLMSDPVASYDPDQYIYGAGQVAGMVASVAPIRQILEEMMEAYEQATKRLASCNPV